MSSVNKVILVGNLGRDPEVRTMQNGGKVVSLSLATSDVWRKDGERQERTFWHNIVIFNDKLGEIAEKYIGKGDLIGIEGALQTRKWEKDGQTHYTTEVVLQKFRGELTLLDSKRDEGGNQGGGYGGGGSDYSEDLSDSIPF